MQLFFFFRKVLIEKLLYSCSDLKEILILVRPKKGKSPESRIEDMFKIPVSIYDEPINTLPFLFLSSLLSFSHQVGKKGTDDLFGF